MEKSARFLARQKAKNDRLKEIDRQIAGCHEDIETAKYEIQSWEEENAVTGEDMPLEHFYRDIEFAWQNIEKLCRQKQEIQQEFEDESTN